VAVKIRLKRMGKIRQPYFRVVVVDSRKKRDGRVIEEIGKYHPKQEPSFIEVSSERAQYWLGVGAQPTEAVEAILKVTGDWQKFKGLPGAEGTLKVAEPKRDKTELFNEALKDAANEPKAEAVTAKKAPAKKAAKKAEEPAAEATPEEPAAAAAEEPATEAAAETTEAAEEASTDESSVTTDAAAEADVAAAESETEA
jgi:small subunit ribosomal protein S16